MDTTCTQNSNLPLVGEVFVKSRISETCGKCFRKAEGGIEESPLGLGAKLMEAIPEQSVEG